MRLPRSVLLPVSRRLGLLAEEAAESGGDGGDQRQHRQLLQVRRLNGFNAFLARIGLAFDPAMSETSLLEVACEAAIRNARLKAAFVAQPDAAGDFQLLADSGPVRQLHDPAFSIQPGQLARGGIVGRVWHERRPVFCADIAHEQGLLPWHERMHALAVRSCAVLPLWRAGRIWAVFGVYDGQVDTFNFAIKTILQEAAAGLSRALTLYDDRRSKAALFDRSQVGIALMRDARIQSANAFAASLAGRVPEDLHDVLAETILARPDHRAQLALAQAQLHASGRASLSGVQMSRPDGHDMIVDLSAAMVDGPHGTDSVWTIEDVTEREGALRLYRGQVNAVSAMLAAGDEAEKCHAVCAALVDDTPFNAVWLVQPDLSSRIGVRARAGRGAELIARLNWRVDQDSGALPVTVRAWREERPVYTNDVATDLAGMPECAKMVRQGWRAALAVPVLRGGRIWAVLTFATARFGGFDETIVALCRQVAELLGQNLDRLDIGGNLDKLRQEEARRVRRDALTTLPNRLALEEYLPKAQERARERGTAMAVGLMELEGVKSVNDTYGRAAGDKVLAELSRRLWESLRENGYVARLEGDEFVVVLENLDTDTANEQAAEALDTLSSVMAKPFVLEDGKTASVGLATGVALFPRDGEKPGALLRQADNAMYRAKQNKGARTGQWCFAADMEDALDFDDDAADLFPIAPYGALAAELMAPAVAAAARIGQRVRTAAIPAIWQKSGGAGVLAHLTAEQRDRLTEREARHLEFLVAPGTTRKEVLVSARTLGTMYALFGAEQGIFVAEQSGYLRLLMADMAANTVSSDDSYRVQQIMEARYRDDRKMRRLIGQGVYRAYAVSLSEDLPSGAWGLVSVEMLGRLAKLPGIQAAFLVRPNAHGELVAQSVAGPCAAVLDEALLRGDARPVIADGSRHGGFVGARAWRTGKRQTCPCIELDAGMAPWHTLMTDLRIHSSLSVPILRPDGTIALVLTLFGSCPNQFESANMREFADGLQVAWETLWKNGQGMSDDCSFRLRQRLFSGGLHMFMQPIIDLATGRLLKVEALARLKDTDDTIFSPTLFLTLLTHDELDRLFLMGLEQSLEWLHAWDAQGLSTEMSVNLPPSCLSDAKILRVVGEMLTRHAIAPGRLTLEVLETQDLDPDRQGKALHELRAMGVQVALDDLGSGHSNLLRLSAMPFDCIKVDRGLLHYIRDVPLQIFSVIRSLQEMGNDMKSTVVVEGLEDAEIIDAIRQLGCRYGQGFGIARPMPAEAVLDWYRAYAGAGRGQEDEDEIRNDLGALACLWTTTRGVAPQAGFRFADGPLMRWLEGRGWNEADAVEWYRILAAGPVSEEVARDLRDWLIDRVVNAGRD